jgi:hypothetical protein
MIATLLPLLAEGPKWTDKMTAIGTAVVAGGVAITAVGAWFAYVQLREARADRQVQVLSEFGRRWDDPLLWEARAMQFDYTNEQLAEIVDRWFTSQDPSAREVPLLLRVPNFFEDISVMVEAGHLELDYVARAMRSLALGQWEYWQLAIEKMREHAPSSYAEFERLVRDLKRAD